ncbi:MAG: cytochrome c oxidase subunit II [Acidobacteriia bacterium]|nr:cytochrome c oxidase subunit II [Terriglobia bacterium]
MPFFQQASSAAGRVDAVFLAITALCVAFLIFITSLMVYFVIKYSKKRHPKGVDIEGNTRLEIVWTATPTILFLAMFYFGWTNFDYERSVPRDAMVITVTARQWAYSFTYPNGKQTTQLFLALNKPVKAELRSLDVIHGFYIPAFRIKEDVVPGKQNYTWFIPTRLGTFDIECTVICGVNHANMLSKAVVVPVAEFEAWYFGDEDAPLPGQTKVAATAARPGNPALAVLTEKSCLSCHSLDGRVMVGPTFMGLYGQKETVKNSDGREREVTVDESRLANAIRAPGADVVKGYPPVMPSVPLKEAELNQVIELIKSLK